MFQNFKIAALTREKYNHYYDNIESKWTPIEPIIKEIRSGKSQSFNIKHYLGFEQKIFFLISSFPTWKMLCRSKNTYKTK